MCHIRDVCQALAINKSRVISSKMKGSLREEKELREKIQQGKSDQTILNRFGNLCPIEDTYEELMCHI